MYSFSKEDKNIVFRHLDAVREAFIDLMTTDQDFIDSIELSTSSVQAITKRFDKWRLTLQDIIGIQHKEPRCFSNQLKEELCDAVEWPITYKEAFDYVNIASPKGILLHGPPGTGKTLVIKKVLNKIQERVEKSNFTIKLVYTNSKDETAIYGLLISLVRQIDLKEDQLPGKGLAISEVFNRLLKKINDEKLGFDVYFVPSIKELDNYRQNSNFNYFQNDSCFGHNLQSFSGSCDNVEKDSGLLIILPDELHNSLTKISVNMQEKVI